MSKGGSAKFELSGRAGRTYIGWEDRRCEKKILWVCLMAGIVGDGDPRLWTAAFGEKKSEPVTQRRGGASSKL